MKRIVIGSAGSGSGKTCFSAGVARAAQRMGLSVRVAKSGPDYLDPLWLSQAVGGECLNLDLWMGDEDGARRAAASSPADLLVVEGAMGLYDGFRPDSDLGSTAHLATVLDAGMAVILDASGSARTFAAVAEGLCRFGAARITGIVANHVGSDGHTALLREALTSRGLPPLLGGIPRGAFPTLASRHLGLSYPPEQAEAILDACADAIEKHLDLKLLLSCAGEGELESISVSTREPSRRVRLGLAWDEAFRFLYPEALEMFQQEGADLVWFSPLADPELPPDLDGLWICGGYPEMHAEGLSKNRSMVRSIQGFCASGKPVLAECGGLMYLCEEIRGVDGIWHPMCGVLPARAIWREKGFRLGYREARLSFDCLLGSAGDRIRGHEFHYSELEKEPPGWERVFELSGSHGPGGSEGYWNGSVLATWVHLWFPGWPRARTAWLERMRGGKQ